MPIGSSTMEGRWERLFADLEAELEAQERLEVDAEIADRTRRERALVSWVDRCGPDRDRPLALDLASGETIRGHVMDVGKDWLLLHCEVGGEALVPHAAVVRATGLGRRTRTETMARRFGLGAALRELSRDRATVDVVDVRGRATTGTIDEVLADALELAEHAAGELRRSANVRGHLVVPFAAITVVRRR